MNPCMWCGSELDAEGRCPYCHEGRCMTCGSLVEYTPGCAECDEARATLFAMTGDWKYKFPHHFRMFEERDEIRRLCV
jgi:hypothetical protein